MSSRPSTWTPSDGRRLGRRGWRAVRRQLLLGVAAAQVAGHALGDRAGRDVTFADGRVQGVEVGVVHRLGELGQHRRAVELLDRQAFLAQSLGQLVAAVLDGVLAALPAEPLADLVAGPGGDDDLQPVPARTGRRDLGGEDLDAVARAELGVERHQAPVDPGPDAAVADLGVDGVGEVDRRGTDRQGDDVALGGEDEDLVLLEVELQRLEELGGVGGLLLPVDDALQPGHVGGRRPLLVAPVGGDAPLGPVVHLRGADLHLEGLALGPDDGGVQATGTG